MIAKCVNWRLCWIQTQQTLILETSKVTIGRLEQMVRLTKFLQTSVNGIRFIVMRETISV